MASTYDLTSGTTDLNFQAHDPNFQILTKVVDFAKFTGTAAGAATNTADVITIPADFVVEDVYVKFITASTTSSSTFGVGDSSDSVYFYANTTSATQTAGTLVSTGATAGASGKFKDVTSVTTFGQKMLKSYTAADKIVVVLGATPPLNGQVKVVVRGFKLV